MLAGFGLLPEQAPDPPSGAIALVNGRPISQSAFERFVTGVTPPGQRAGLDDVRRARLLREAIDEELLLQQGLALGLARIDPQARRAVVAMMALVVTGAAAVDEPDDETLERFRAAHPERLDADAALPEVRARVRAAWLREQRERALARYVADLHEDAEIVILDPALHP